MQRKIRVLVGKPGLDGHDRGAKVVAAALRDAGMEVIYTGLHQSPQQIVEAAVQEDVDVVALSVLSGAHMTLFPEVRRLLEQRGLGDRLLTGGGIIPADDMESLTKLGVGRLFGPGSSTQDIVTYIRGWFVRRYGEAALELPPQGPVQTERPGGEPSAQAVDSELAPVPLPTAGRLAGKRTAERAERLARLKAEAAHHLPGARQRKGARGGPARGPKAAGAGGRSAAKPAAARKPGKAATGGTARAKRSAGRRGSTAARKPRKAAAGGRAVRAKRSVGRRGSTAAAKRSRSSRASARRRRSARKLR
jgi:methylmalonyl-CoA mutase C-terminal domain/subunit